MVDHSYYIFLLKVNWSSIVQFNWQGNWNYGSVCRPTSEARIKSSAEKFSHFILTSGKTGFVTSCSWSKTNKNNHTQFIMCKCCKAQVKDKYVLHLLCPNGVVENRHASVLAALQTSQTKISNSKSSIAPLYYSTQGVRKRPPDWNRNHDSDCATIKMNIKLYAV